MHPRDGSSTTTANCCGNPSESGRAPDASGHTESPAWWRLPGRPGCVPEHAGEAELDRRRVKVADLLARNRQQYPAARSQALLGCIVELRGSRGYPRRDCPLSERDTPTRPNRSRTPSRALSRSTCTAPGPRQSPSPQSRRRWPQRCPPESSGRETRRDRRSCPDLLRASIPRRHRPAAPRRSAPLRLVRPVARPVVNTRLDIRARGTVALQKRLYSAGVM